MDRQGAKCRGHSACLNSANCGAVLPDTDGGARGPVVQPLTAVVLVPA